MNPTVLHALAESRVQEIRRDSHAWHLAGQPRLSRDAWPGRGRGRAARLRVRIGCTLVEAGLHLVATASPMTDE
jgi:hypothetical protein